MQPVELHERLLAALSDHRTVTFDEIVLVPQVQSVEPSRMLDWLAWARRTGHIEDAGTVDGRKLYRLLPLHGEAWEARNHGLGSEDVDRSRNRR